MQDADIEKIYNEYFKTVYKYLICLTHSKEIAEDLLSWKNKEEIESIHLVSVD